MTKKNRPTPWRDLVHLKDELRTGELTLAEFAADLHDVAARTGKRKVYEDPEKFFALTFPTHPLRELAKDVAQRLAGKSDKAIRQLELTYGGGKTHTLITLYHLFGASGELPDLPAVREFREHLGMAPPRAFVATLCFDKLDAEKGIAGVRGPDGATRDLFHPWSVLAYQLAGDDGLRAIHAEGKPEERETPPAEPLVARLLESPRERGFEATLVLIDEVLMYARAKSLDEDRSDRLTDFFQYLLQAVARVDTAAVVISLLASDPRVAQGKAAKRFLVSLSNILRRQREPGVEPVRKQDVPEVLRRRLFRDDFSDLQGWRPQAIAVARNFARMESGRKKPGSREEDRLLHGFPFHPDLTDVFYSLWTQLAGFQRTRGILRVLAMAIRESEKRDAAPLVGPSAFLAASDSTALSEAVSELAEVATKEPGEGISDWSALLVSELEKAQEVQQEFPALREGREIEQAVLAVFFHSQPIGQKAATPDLLRLIGGGGLDRIEVQKGLQRWREISWFLDDEDTGLTPSAGELPRSWRLGNRPNLRQMHDQASRKVSADSVDAALIEAIRKEKPALTGGASGAGAAASLLPVAPKEVADDGRFRYAVLGPDAVSDSGKPSRLAKRYLDETTDPERPRAHRNAVVLAVPGRDGLEAARIAARALLGWKQVETELRHHKVDAAQQQRLRQRLTDARGHLPEMVRQAYSVVVTVGPDNEAQAFRLKGSTEPLFLEIKNEEKARIRDTPVNAAALLPEGPYDLWRESDEARPLQDIASAFSRFARMPKLLKSGLVLDTVLGGVAKGVFAARLRRPDGTVRTWWREPVDAASRTDALEIVLPEKAELSHLVPDLLAPGKLPDLWTGEGPAARLPWEALLAYFAGGHAVARPGREPLAIPACPEAEVKAAAVSAVGAGTVWLNGGAFSLWKEPVPEDALRPGVSLRPPPAKIEPAALAEEAVPAAWSEGATNGAALLRARSAEASESLPWGILRDSIQDAVVARWLQIADDSGPVDCDVDDAGQVRLTRPPKTVSRPVAPTAPAGVEVELEDSEIQDLAERVGDLRSAAAGRGLRFRVRVTVAPDTPAGVRAEVNRLLAEISDDLKVT